MNTHFLDLKALPNLQVSKTGQCLKKKKSWVFEGTYAWNYDFQLISPPLNKKPEPTLKLYQIKLISRFFLKCVMGQDRLIFDDWVSACSWNKPWILDVSSPFPPPAEMLHTEQPMLKRNKGDSKSSVFIFITQKSNKGLGSRQPRPSFPLCAPRLPL